MFDITGTPEQVRIVEDAIAACDFPWQWLANGLRHDTGRTAIPVEWADLSRYTAQVAAQRESGGHEHIHEDGDTADPLEARERVLGLFWYSGRIQIDLSLTNDPRLAAEVFLSEVAHAVDVFYLTPDQRRKIWDLYHEGQSATAEHDAAHGWFDVPFKDWEGDPW
jgi:hypothetical protein